MVLSVNAGRNILKRVPGGFAVNVNPAVMLLDHAVNHGEAEPCSLGGNLGGKKRLKNVSYHLGRHSATAVFKGQTDEFTGPGIGKLSAVEFINLCIFGYYTQSSALRHGVPGVDHEV